MFHIQGLDGFQINIPLEELNKDERVSRLEKSRVARKVIERREDQTEKENISSAVQAYKNAIKQTTNCESILHAYEIMKSPVFTLNCEMSIPTAWKYMEEKRVSYMPVLSKDKKVSGILSDKDLLKSLSIINCSDNDVSLKGITEIMTTKVITSSQVTDIRRIAKAMFDNHIGSMPISDDSGGLLGIVTRSDILYALINHPSVDISI